MKLQQMGSFTDYYNVENYIQSNFNTTKLLEFHYVNSILERRIKQILIFVSNYPKKSSLKPALTGLNWNMAT